MVIFTLGGIKSCIIIFRNPEHGKLGHPQETTMDKKVSTKQYSTSTTFNKGDAPKKVSLGKTVKQAACANQHTVCLTVDGEVLDNGYLRCMCGD